MKNIVLFKEKLKKVGNLFIISLACADLIVGSFVMPLATSYAITETWNMCKNNVFYCA
jgi:hypothetical protein